MPRRLLFVDHEKLRVKLVETGRQSRRYCAPSWSWASMDSVPKLNNIPLFLLQEGMATSAMPTWFNDCCSVMKMASLDYIWVDSLCINQTDLADRSREILRMPEIYQSAEMTIVPRISIEGRRYHKRQLDWGKLRLHCRDDTYQTLSHAKEIMKEGMTPLHLAVMKGNTDMVRLLLDTGLGGGALHATPASPKRSLTGASLVELPLEDNELAKMLKYAENAHSKAAADTTDTSDSTGNVDNTATHPAPSIDNGSLEMTILDSDIRSQNGTMGALAENNDEANDQKHDVANIECFQETFSVATKAIEDGRKSLQDRNTIGAIGHFLHARDLVSNTSCQHSDLLRLHMVTSNCLAMVYLKESMPRFALNAMTASETLMKDWKAVSSADTLA